MLRSLSFWLMQCLMGGGFIGWVVYSEPADKTAVFHTLIHVRQSLADWLSVHLPTGQLPTWMTAHQLASAGLVIGVLLAWFILCWFVYQCTVTGKPRRPPPYRTIARKAPRDRSRVENGRWIIK